MYCLYRNFIAITTITHFPQFIDNDNVHISNLGKNCKEKKR